MRKPLKPRDGYVLTNGVDIYCNGLLYLAEGVSKDTFYEITEAEYAEIKAKQEAEMERMMDYDYHP